MLVSLSIRDFVLIERLDVEFAAGFTALTGETGAGKSILLDALGLVCGGKAEAAQVRPGALRAEITAAFSVAPGSAVATLLKDTASDDESGQVLLRRVIEAEGRSRAFINGRPAAISELRAVGELLVDVHAQHEHQSLTKPATQRELLDAFAQAAEERQRVASAWAQAHAAQQALERALHDADSIARERAELEERATFLRALAPSAREWLQLTEEHTRTAHAQTLLDAAAESIHALDGEAQSVRAILERCISRLRSTAKFDPALTEFVDLLDSAAIQVAEAGHGLRSYVDKFDLDPARIQVIEERMSALHQAARRFRVPVEQLEGLLEQTTQRLTELAQSADVAALEAQAQAAHNALHAACERLTQKRVSAAKKLERTVNTLVKDLALGHARFEVQLQPLARASTYGAEDIQFRFSAHPSLPMQPIHKSASGGELARVALAIMVAVAQADGVPTLVFDEVDVGIGGGVAAIVGANLRTLGKSRQVFAVTHQAQVAAHAHEHFAVRKLESGTTRGVVLERLHDAARTDELARMLAGRETTATTRAHARELLMAGQRA